MANMANEGFDKTVSEENGPELFEFAYHIISYYFKLHHTITEDKNLQRRLAIWLRGKYPKNMVDPNAPLTDAKFKLNETIHIPPKDEIIDIIGMFRIKVCVEGVTRVPSRLCKARWLDTEGNELPDDYYIEERTLCMSVEYKGKSDTQITFSVYRQCKNGTFEIITENLRAEKKDDTDTFVAQLQYKRERERAREENVKLYFRAHKNNTVQTESAVRSFIDGIVAIETERNIKIKSDGKFFDFDNVDVEEKPAYGGFQKWYTEEELFKDATKKDAETKPSTDAAEIKEEAKPSANTAEAYEEAKPSLNIAGWDKKKGKKMNESGCGPIAATNVIYYYAQQFNASFAKLKTPNGFQDTPKKPNKEEYARMAFSVYNYYTMQTLNDIFPGIGWGIWYIDPLCDGIIKFAQERGIGLKKHILTNKMLASDNSFRQAADFITEGLKNNYPVILLVTFNSYIAKLDKRTMMQLHFVTITAIKRTKSDEEDYELTISTWGDSKTILSLKEMWKGTPALFNITQIATVAAVASTALKKTDEEKPAWVDGLQKAATVATAIAPIPLSFASISLGYCSFD